MCVDKCIKLELMTPTQLNYFQLPNTFTCEVTHKLCSHNSNAIQCVNDRPFYMVVLVGYSDAGWQIVVVVRSGRLSLSRQPRVVASSSHDSGAAER